ncbi:hypothetical protein GQ457_17G008270 [Hibiscus cannabinus]
MRNYAKFLKDMVSRKKRIEEFETAAATETCLALMHNKVPAKKTGPGSFTIECFIGHNYPTKALCDPGASINLMPKSIFQKLGIGEAKPTTLMMQLTDHSYVQPEGKIEDILVQVDKFIFPADFLILDCEAVEHAPIILGRPFLSTSRAIIDFDKDEIVFKIDENNIKMKSITKKLDKGKSIAKSPAKDISQGHPQNEIIYGWQSNPRQKRVCHLLGTRRTFNTCPAKMASARYTMVAAKNRCEEQGFYFDDSLPNYGLEQFVYNRLNELGWFRLARQPASANYNWVIEFYANNAAGEDFSTVRGRRFHATVATINAILGLPNNEPSFYAMLGGFEEEDYEVIKNFLCLPNTEWNTMGRNPNSVSRLSLKPEAKLWNTFVKRNLMPTSHNQTVDRTRRLLINTILTGYKVNVGEILAKELASACANDKGILAFPCLISALCRRAAVPMHDGDKYQSEKTGWTRAVYMRKMDVADAAPLNNLLTQPPQQNLLTQPPQKTPPASPPVVPISSQTTTSPATTPAAQEHSRATTPDKHLGSTPSSSPSPPPPAPAQSEEAAPPLHIMQLRSQLQCIEARQIHFQEEMKVFNANLLKFLHFQFPAAASFFAQTSATPPQPNVSTAAQPSATSSAKAGATEEVHFSSDDENDVCDWQSPRDHLQPLGPITTTPTPAVPILSVAPTPTTFAVAERPTPDSPARRKGKATAGRTLGREIHSSPEDEADQRPAKRRRKYHVITADSDEEDSSAEIPVFKPMQSADPSFSPTIYFLYSANSSLSHVFLPCIEDNTSLEFGGALV